MDGCDTQASQPSHFEVLMLFKMTCLWELLSFAYHINISILPGVSFIKPYVELMLKVYVRSKDENDIHKGNVRFMKPYTCTPASNMRFINSTLLGNVHAWICLILRRLHAPVQAYTENAYHLMNI